MKLPRPSRDGRPLARSCCQAAFLLLLLALAGCDSGTGGSKVDVAPDPGFGPRGSSTIVRTADDRRLLVVNPDADTLSVFDLIQQEPVKTCELAVGSDPRSVAVTA